MHLFRSSADLYREPFQPAQMFCEARGSTLPEISPTQGFNFLY